MKRKEAATKDRELLSRKTEKHEELLFNLLAEKASDGIFLISGRKIEYVNPAFSAMTGFSAQEIVGLGLKQIEQQIHPEDRAKFLQLIKAAQGKNKTSPVVTLRFFTKQNRLIYLEVSSSALLIKNKILCVARNITDLVLISQKTKESELLYRSLVEKARAGIAIIQDEKIKFVNPSLCRIIGYKKNELIGSNFINYLRQQDKEKIKALYHQRLAGERMPSHYELQLPHKDGRLIYVEIDSSIFEYQGAPAKLAVVYDITTRQRAEEELLATLKKLRQAFGGTIRALNGLTELKDPYTAGHQRRVADLARSIAKKLGLSTDQIDGLRLAASIHDIGKVVLPSEIMSKPGKLTSNEWNLIRTHPQIGYNILKDICFPWPIAQIVHQHHERLDGSGYPLGLKAEEICLEAKILAVADVVEAMSSHRPYRAAYSMREALEEIIRNKGKLYDETVVDACVALFKKNDYRLK